MKTLLFFLLFISTLHAFDYANNIDYHTFKIDELTRINDIDYELSVFEVKTKEDEQLKKELEKQRIQNIEKFLHKLMNGECAGYNLLDMKRRYKALLSEKHSIDLLNQKFSREEYIAHLVMDLNIRSLKLRIAFMEFVYKVKGALDSYASQDEFDAILVDFRQELIFNPHLYNMVFNDIINIGAHKTSEMMVYLAAYDKLFDELDVYNAIFMYFEGYTSKVLETDSLLYYFDINTLVKYLDDHLKGDRLDLFLHKHFHTSAAQFCGSLLIIAVAFIFYAILFKLLELLLHSLYCKPRTPDEHFDNIERRKYEVGRSLEFLRTALSKPLKLFLTVFSLDIMQRLEFIASPRNEDLVYYFEGAYAIILIWALFRLVDHFVYFYSDSFLKTYPTMRKEIINFFLIFSKLFIITSVSLILLDAVGANISGILASLGIGGLAIALAAREALTNVFGSIQIILDNAFSQGQWIVTEKYQGTVVEIGLRSTKIRTFDNAMVFAPNAYLANTEIKNWDKRQVGRRIKMYIGVCYGSKMSNIVDAVNDIRAMLKAHEDIADDETKYELSKEMRTRILKQEDEYGIAKTLLVYIDNFGESSINIMVYCFSKTTNWQTWLEVKQDVLVKIAAILENHNLSFAFPSQTLYLNNDSGKPLEVVVNQNTPDNTLKHV